MRELRTVFLLIVNMSLTAGMLVPIVFIARALLAKAPKSFSYALWGIVGFRLICPVSIASIFSVFSIPAVKENVAFKSVKIPGGTMYAQVVDMPRTFPGTIQKVGAVTRSAMDVFDILAIIWLLGIAAFLVYESIAWIKLKKQVSQAVKYNDSVYECDRIQVPFVMGIFKPRIYLPFRLSDEERRYVLLHEEYHVRRKDYLIKFLAVVLLTVYWFQPLAWLAFWGMSRDMEMSCDEWVLRKLGDAVKTDYSDSLLAFAVGRRVPVISPLAFGESSVKTRIKNILSFKKCKKTVLAGAMLVCVAVVVFGVTNGKDRKGTQPIEAEKNSSSFAKELYQAKTPYIGNASAVGRLLKILDVGSLGAYTMELQTSEEPYVLKVHFEKEPKRPEALDARMGENAVVLLALIENAGEVQWSYPINNGEELYTMYCDWEWANTFLEVRDVKKCAESAEALQGMLKKLGETFLGTGEVVWTGNGYQVPGGETYQYRLMLTGRTLNAAMDTTYVVYTDDKNLTFEEVSNRMFSSTWFPEGIEEDGKRSMYISYFESFGSVEPAK